MYDCIHTDVESSVQSVKCGIEGGAQVDFAVNFFNYPLISLSDLDSLTPVRLDLPHEALTVIKGGKGRNR